MISCIFRRFSEYSLVLRNYVSIQVFNSKNLEMFTYHYNFIICTYKYFRFVLSYVCLTYSQKRNDTLSLVAYHQET